MLRIYSVSFNSIRYRNFYGRDSFLVHDVCMISKYLKHADGRCYFIQTDTIFNERDNPNFKRLYHREQVAPKAFFIPNTQFFLDSEKGELFDTLPPWTAKEKTYQIDSSCSPGALLQFLLDSQHSLNRYVRCPRSHLEYQIMHNRTQITDHDRHTKNMALLYEMLLLMKSSSTHRHSTQVFDFIFTFDYYPQMRELFNEIMTVQNAEKLKPEYYVTLPSYCLVQALQRMFEPSVVGKRRGDSFLDNMHYFFNFSPSDIHEVNTLGQNNIAASASIKKPIYLTEPVF